MTTIFDKGEPFYSYSKKKFNGKVYSASSIHNIHDNIDQTVKDWRDTNFLVRVLKIPSEKVQIIYLREKE